MKCGNYWQSQSYGSIQLKLVSQTGGEDHITGAHTGFDFGSAAATPQPHSPTNIKRIFQVSHAKGGPPRMVVQFQCVSWPDFDVPESSETLLSLIRDVDGAVDEMEGSDCCDDRTEVPPVLVHCEPDTHSSKRAIDRIGSAGVGRTGSFIVVDAIIDGLRRERKMGMMSSRESSPDAERSSVNPSSLDEHDIPSFASTDADGSSAAPSSAKQSARGSVSSLDPDDALNKRWRFLSTKSGGSGDSGKSVSFVEPMISPSHQVLNASLTSSLPSVSTSAISSTVLTPMVHTLAEADSYTDVKAMPPGQAMGMDIPSAGSSDQNALKGWDHSANADSFMRHRGSVGSGGSAGSEPSLGRRPSLLSNDPGSAEYISFDEYVSHCHVHCHLLTAQHQQASERSCTHHEV